MGKNTINFPHMFFPIWSIGLFFAMGEYPMIDELGLYDVRNTFSMVYAGTWLNQNIIMFNKIRLFAIPAPPVTGFLWTSPVINGSKVSISTTNIILRTNTPCSPISFLSFVKKLSFDIPNSIWAGFLEPVWSAVYKIRSKNIDSWNSPKFSIIGFPLYCDNQSARSACNIR